MCELGSPGGTAFHMKIFFGGRDGSNLKTRIFFTLF